MNTKVENALNRLTGILPLQARQQDCSNEVKALHQQILGSFVKQGHILTRDRWQNMSVTWRKRLMF